MAVQENPFVYGRPISREEDLADREEEKRALRRDVLSGQPVMMHAPRRYGKTSLARVVAERLQEDGTPYVYADLWGVRSIADVVGVLGEAYSRSSGLARVRRSIAELLRGIGFEVNLGGVLSVRYEGSVGGATEDEERRALRELLGVPETMAQRSPSGRLLLVLDEFGELNNVPGEPDAPMRAAFQDSPNVSFVFLGSKRSLMDALFSNRRRPFYNFGKRMELGRLPYDEVGDFVVGQPYRAQQIAYHAFEWAL
jgi:AAA+ ATPase superfamily predicted ATPase